MKKGFTLIELLVVVSIIGVLATIVLSSLSAARDRARIASAQATFKQIEKMVVLAQINTNQPLGAITGSYCSHCSCSGAAGGLTGTACTSRWQTSINAIAVAAGEDISYAENFYTDPWGNPYLLDENEGEGGNYCIRDAVRTSAGVPSLTGIGSFTNLQLPSSLGRC